jgi:hypothetical protein
MLVLTEFVHQLTMHAINNMKVSECCYVIICKGKGKVTPLQARFWLTWGKGVRGIALLLQDLDARRE